MTANNILQLSPEDRLSAIREKIAAEEYSKSTIEVIKERVIDDIPESKTLLHLYLTESQISLLYKILDQEERKVQALKDKTTSYTKRGDYEVILGNLDEIRKSITDQ